MKNSRCLLICAFGIVLLFGCQHVSAGDEESSESEPQDTSSSTEPPAGDTVSTDTETEGPDSATSELHVPDSLFKQWRLSSLVYMGETQTIDPETQNPALNIYRDKDGNTVISASACYQGLDDYCEISSESEISCSGYRNHSIIWGTDPFPCSDDEMTIEVRFYLSMERASTYELQDETLVLVSNDGLYKILFEL